MHLHKTTNSFDLSVILTSAHKKNVGVPRPHPLLLFRKRKTRSSAPQVFGTRRNSTKTPQNPKKHHRQVQFSNPLRLLLRRPIRQNPRRVRRHLASRRRRPSAALRV